MPFEKGHKKSGGSRPGNKPSKLKSFRKALAESRFNVVAEMIDLHRKTKDESLKFEILKTILDYSQLKPQTDLDEEGADVGQISERQLLALASGDTVIAPGPDSDTDSFDQDAVREGDTDAADALDAAQDESES